METMRPSSPSPSTQAVHGTAPAKNRAAHAQGTAAAGDFLGMLSALSETMFSSTPVLDATAATDVGDGLASDAADDKGKPSKKLFSLLSASGDASIPSAPVLNATQAATDSSAMASLLALQAGFSGATHAPLNTQSAATTDTVSLGGTNALLAAAGSRGVAVASSGGELGLVAQTGVPTSLGVGSRGVAVASSGGELGLVAQTAALDGATETQAEQGLGAVAKKITTSSRLMGSSTEALTARSTLSLRQEPLERTASQAALVSALQAAVIGTDAPRDPIAGVQHQSAWGTPPSSMQAPVGILGQDVGLSSNGQNSARGGEGGRGASGQNSDSGALFGMDGLMEKSASVGEAPVFDAASALPTEDAVAEEVSYWVNQNIQNAELTVDHDGHPVEVTVTLSGNEAHVSFRSDQNETRSLLDASVAQLRDLLESQGLSLSGMTVGDSSRQGNSNDSQRQGAKGARQTSVQADGAPVERTRSAGTVTDKAVDIFV